MNPEDEALLSAKACEAIYGTTAEPIGRLTAQKAMEAEGFSNFLWFDLPTLYNEVCAFIASSVTDHILVFRGTKAPQDWITDLTCLTSPFDALFLGSPNVGSVHEGFGRCLADYLPRIIIPLSHRDTSKPLLITGHSLGGAFAALAGACFAFVPHPISPVSCIYTFGQPRIGLLDFCESYQRKLEGKLIRFVNKKDIVPRVPFRGADYSDVGRLLHFDSAGQIILGDPIWQGEITRILESCADFSEIMMHLKVDVSDHSMRGYREVVEKQKVTLASLLRRVP